MFCEICMLYLLRGHYQSHANLTIDTRYDMNLFFTDDLENTCMHLVQ